MLDILLITGMRYIEFIRLYDHAEWYNEKRNIIHLPEELKESTRGGSLREQFTHYQVCLCIYSRTSGTIATHQAKLAGTKTCKDGLRLRGIQPYGMSVKTTRKTIESWLIAAGIPEFTVCLRQGHDNLTSMRHTTRD